MFKPLEKLLFGSVAMTGFAAGALMVASIKFGAQPASAADAPLRAEPASTAAHDAPGVNAMPAGVSGPLPAPGAWPYESSDGRPRGNPGKMRPDRLSGPDGWTYHPAEGNGR